MISKTDINDLKSDVVHVNSNTPVMIGDIVNYGTRRYITVIEAQNVSHNISIFGGKSIYLFHVKEEVELETIHIKNGILCGSVSIKPDYIVHMPSDEFKALTYIPVGYRLAPIYSIPSRSKMCAIATTYGISNLFIQYFDM